MTHCSPEHRARHWLSGLLLALVPALGLAAPIPTPFEASYGFYRNGKLVGESRFSLTVQQKQWTLTTSSVGTRGVARLLGLEEYSSSSGTWAGGRPRPEQFEQRIKVAVKNIEKSARFDWQAGKVTSAFDDTQLTMDLPHGVLDAVSEGLAIRAGLSKGRDQWTFQVLDEDEFEQHLFRADAPERSDTALGCLQVVTVHRIRHAGSTRYTRTQYASALDWVPVRVEHGKTDGDQMESRIEALSINGRNISVSAPCP